MLCRSVGFTVKRHHCIRGTWAWRHSFKRHGRSWPMRGGFRPCCRSRSIPTNWSKCPRQSTNKGPMRYGFLRSGRRPRPTPHARRRTEGLAQSAAQRKAATSAGAQLACHVGGIVAEPFFLALYKELLPDLSAIAWPEGGAWAHVWRQWPSAPDMCHLRMKRYRSAATTAIARS